MPEGHTPTTLKGYAALSRYVSLSDGLQIFRRFGELHVRSLLFMQDELRVLEEKLHGCDSEDGEHGSRRWDKNRARKGLMGQIRSKLREYDECVLAFAAIRKFDNPKSRPLAKLRAFLEAKRPLVEPEEPKLDDDRDLLCLKTWEDSFPTWITEKLKLGDWTRLTEDTAETDRLKQLDLDLEGMNFRFISPPKIRRMMRILVVFAGCLFLLVPVILLFFLQTDTAKLVIIVCSLLLFSSVTAAVTTAKNWEVVAASIAYAAVLVVFVGSNVGQSRLNAI